MKHIHGTEVLTELAEIVAPRHTALLIVDVQRDFCADDGVAARSGRDISRIKAALPALRRVVEAARRAGVLPIYLQNIWLPDARSNSGPWLRFIADSTSVDVQRGWTLQGSPGAESSASRQASIWN